MKLVQNLRSRSVIQFICMIAIAVTSIFHVDASLASTRADGAVAFAASQDDDQNHAGNSTADLCNFCSWTAACIDVVTPSSLEPVRQTVPSGRTRSLTAFKIPATAPPPRS